MKIQLFTSYYEVSDKARMDEYAECLSRNIANPYIDKVTLLAEGGYSGSHPKLEVKITSRPTYSDFIKLFHDNCINIISNSDIWFDETLKYAQDLDEDECYALTRYEFNGNGPYLFRGYFGDSQDAWIFRGRVNVESDMYLGRPRCDQVIAGTLKNAGYRLSNPAGLIRSYHIHESQVRTYDPKVHYPGRGLYVWPSFPLGVASGKEVTHSPVTVVVQNLKSSPKDYWKMLADEIGASFECLVIVGFSDNGTSSDQSGEIRFLEDWSELTQITTDIVVFLDGRAKLRSGWWNSHLQFHTEYQDPAVCFGPVTFKQEDKELAWWKAIKPYPKTVEKNPVVHFKNLDGVVNHSMHRRTLELLDSSLPKNGIPLEAWLQAAAVKNRIPFYQYEAVTATVIQVADVWKFLNERIDDYTRFRFFLEDHKDIRWQLLWIFPVQIPATRLKRVMNYLMPSIPTLKLLLFIRVKLSIEKRLFKIALTALFAERYWKMHRIVSKK